MKKHKRGYYFHFIQLNDAEYAWTGEKTILRKNSELRIMDNICPQTTE